MDFNQYIDMLLEGGAAMDASRIQVGKIKSTFDKYIKDVIKNIDPKAQYKTIGSLGKKETSGDIDVAIKTDLDLQTVSDKLTSLGIRHKVNKGLKQIYTEFPIFNHDGTDSGEKVQVDLMFGDVEFLSATYWAPGESQSKYSGSDLSIIFASITRFTKIHEIKNQENKEALKEFKKEHPDLTYSYVYDINRGIFIKVRWMEELKAGKNKGQMGEKSDRLPNPEATTVEDVLAIWNKDSKVEWTKQDFNISLEKVWQKAKKAFSSEKLRSIMDYINPSMENKPQLESKFLNSIYMEMLNESV